ncbi:MAG: asparagine synthase (glutamine-hydrolyzing) [Luteibaculaceae bacterium]
MCGIAGQFYFSPQASPLARNAKVHNALQQRGPDQNGFFSNTQVALYHNRLSILDLSELGRQPMQSACKRYTLAFNGEIFNFKSLRKTLQEKGYTFISETDSEVVLYMYQAFGSAMLHQLNGFFALAVYDAEENSLFLARDRYGIKPLHIYQDAEKICFASELKALTAMGIPKKINTLAVHTYFRLTYIPAPMSIYEGVSKLMPGHFLAISGRQSAVGSQQSIISQKPKAESRKLKAESYYSLLPATQTPFTGSYEDAKKQLEQLMDQSVQDRLMADVPLGCFLSGGIDSSVVSTLAARHVNQLNTFSIGFADEPFYDETAYAEAVAKNIKSNHTVFQLRNQDFYDTLQNTLDYLDEPFGDSSALAVNILCKRTVNHVTVALSGDGGDELFTGYNKHFAEWKTQNLSSLDKLILSVEPILRQLPKSRQSAISNKIRQLEKFASNYRLNPEARWLNWACFHADSTVNGLLLNPSEPEFTSFTKQFTGHFGKGNNPITDILAADVQMLLQGDMLTKVDLMSMNNSLEVRVPFLDYRVVDFAFSLPDAFKINAQLKKRIVQDTFRPILPEQLFNRPKRGFEVPLTKWFQKELYDTICNHYLADDFIVEQGIFNLNFTRNLKKQLKQPNPGDIQSLVWSLIVFQNWFIGNRLTAFS